MTVDGAVAALKDRYEPAVVGREFADGDGLAALLDAI
jgi:hypothetical protein